MAMHPLEGHAGARRRIAESVAKGSLPQVVLITGPEGVGKQRFGLWTAQLLMCSARTATGPCGACKSCRLVLELSHPDLHWFVPIPRPKSGEVGKQVEEAGDLLAEVMASRRESPLYEAPDGMASHSLASARLLLRKVALTPAAGAQKVILMGHADRLVTQDASPEAANALLKVLEEPPANTWIILTTTEPERVLPTIRSRAVPLRLTRIPDADVRAFVAAHVKPAPDAGEVAELVARAEGVIGRLAGGRAEGHGAATDARALLEAVKAGSGARFERSLRQAPWSARGGFTDLLDALANELAAEARRASGGGNAAPFVAALEKVQAARIEAQTNVNPQLLLAALTGELAEVL